MSTDGAARHARVRAVFLDAIERPAAERDAFLRDACGADARTLSEVRSLLRHHDSNTLIKAPATESTARLAEGSGSRPGDGGAGTARRTRPASDLPTVAGRTPAWWRRNIRPAIAALVASLALVALLAWTTARVRASLERVVGEHLAALADAGVTGVEAWIDAQRTLVAGWAQDPRVAEQTQELVRAAGGAEAAPDAAADALRTAPALSVLRGMFEPLAELSELRGFGVLGADGRVLLTRGLPPPEPELLGQMLPAPMRLAAAPVFEGHPHLVLPYDVAALVPPELLPPPAGARPADDPLSDVVLSVLAPIRAADGSVVAALAFQLRPERDFTRILATPLAGATGELYAFDRQGRLLSESRFVDQLQHIGLLPDAPGTRSALSLSLRDPGADLTAEEHAPPTPPESRPLTRMVAAALAGLDGVDTQGYRDYRGVEVVGAWRWLEQDGFGVAFEQDRDEAYAALAFPRRAMVVLLVVLGTVLLVLLALAGIVARLRRSVREVRRLGQYTLEEFLGEGGMGRVYRARHALLARPTAIKVLRPDRIDATTLARFESEVQLTTRLSHPNTIEVWDYGRTPEGLFYYAMEYLDGLTLEHLVALEGAQPASRVIHILRQVCLSLREAHALGLVHRDVKPGNIVLCERGGEADVVKVLDFGLARDLHAEPDTRLTAAHGILGTPLYISPERLRAATAPDARSDLYALGAVAFKLLAGQDLYAGESVFEITAQTLNATPRRPSTCTPLPVPEDLDLLVLELLAKDPARRPASAQAVLDLLDAVRGLSPWTADDARDWWAVHRQEVRELRNLARGGPARTATAASAATAPTAPTQARAAAPGAAAARGAARQPPG